MKKPILFLLIALNTSICLAQFNTEAAHKYFDLVDQVRQGQPLTDSLWQAFLSIEGNWRVILENGVSENRVEEYRKKIELIYNSSTKTLSQSQFKNDYDFKAIYRYKTEELELKAHLQWIEHTHLFDSMLVAAKKYLPPRMHEFESKPDMYIIALWATGTASDSSIIISLPTSYDFDNIKAGIFGAHELHHFLRKTKTFKAIDEKDKGIMWAIDAALNEGLADLVDKPYILGDASNWPSKHHYDSVNTVGGLSVIPAFNDTLMALAEGKKDIMTEQDYRTLFQNSVGHVPGYSMAKTIRDNGLLPELIESADDPFKFIYLYNKAAKKDITNPPVFNKKAINYLIKLEKKYVIE